MELLNELKALVPDYAKDVRLNLDATVARSSLAPADAVAATRRGLRAAYAAASSRRSVAAAHWPTRTQPQHCPRRH